MLRSFQNLRQQIGRCGFGETANTALSRRIYSRSGCERADFTATSQRFVHWDQVNETQMPFLTMLKTGEVRGGKQAFAARVNLLAITMPERSYMRSSLAEMAGEIREELSESAGKATL